MPLHVLLRSIAAQRTNVLPYKTMLPEEAALRLRIVSLLTRVLSAMPFEEAFAYGLEDENVGMTTLGLVD
jgi:hypothetical protein